MRDDHARAVTGELMMRTLDRYEHETISEQPLDDPSAIALHV